MKVAGFSIIKDAITYDYPIAEALRSILPICDKVFVAVGESGDATRDLVQQIDPEKIVILDTQWDTTQREGGRVLALETDKAFQAIPKEFDWCFYIQGDEVLHEKYHTVVKDAMFTYWQEQEVESLLFNYKHFYGSYDYVAEASNFYKKEIRIIRNNKAIFSYRDAQGFRKLPNEKLRAKYIEAFIYHYGWVKHPNAMQSKQLNFNTYWHNDEWIEKNIAQAEFFDYSNIKTLSRFTGSHPEVMLARIDKINWQFDYDLSKSSYSVKDRLKLLLNRWFGINLNYQNYIEV